MVILAPLHYASVTLRDAERMVIRVKYKSHPVFYI